MCVYSKNCSDLTPVRCFFTFSYPSHLKHLVLRAFLEDCLPEMLSKLGVLAERGIKKSKKHHTIAPIKKQIILLCFLNVFYATWDFGVPRQVLFLASLSWILKGTNKNAKNIKACQQTSHQAHQPASLLAHPSSPRLLKKMCT